MVSSILSVGDKLDISVMQQTQNTKQEKDDVRVLRSMIYDIKEDGSLEIGMPSEGGKMVLLTTGVRYNLLFYAQGKMYECIGQVKERYKTDNLYMVTMELKSNLSKVQRRAYYRYECLLDMFYFPVTEAEVEISESEEILAYYREQFPEVLTEKGVAVDISGGGMRFISDKPLEEGKHVLLTLHLVSGKFDREFLIVGTVIQSNKMETDIRKYEHRIKFNMRDDRVREQIIQYIFMEERKNRKNKKD